MTRDDLIKHQDALKAKFDPTETIAWPQVSMSQLSVARYYGGCTVNDKWFIYFPASDMLIRDDVVAFINKLNKANEKKPAETPETTQPDLFAPTP